MSNATKVEQRVVQMKFDNKGFAAGVENTLGALKNLQNGILNAENLTKALGKVDLSGLNNAIQTIENRFSTMGIVATSILQNVASQAYYTATNMANALSVDQIYAGWDKYNEKTLSVQTIMNATGKSIQEVEAEMDKLQWFTDETSYNFTDMVANIGKFTSAGLSLEKSRIAMQGIALWAAQSGVNATDASRAMFQLSQAISQGAIKGNDWMSIESLTMATSEFKDIVLETAVSMGKLTKEGDKFVTKYGGTKHVFDANTFRTYLSDGWFDTEVFMKAMEKYGTYADKLKQFQDEHGIETATEAMRQMGDAGDEFGKKVFESGQITRTFEDAINATKDAVSSGWSQTWQLVFGDLEEAKELWGDLTERLWDAFAASGEVRNEMLKEWRYLGGQEVAVESFRKAWDTLKETIDAVKTGIQEVFPPLTGERLNEFTRRIYSLVKALSEFNTKHLEDFQRIGKGAASILDILLKGFTKVWSIVTGTVKTLKGDVNIMDTVVEFLASVADSISKLDKRIDEVGFIKAFGEVVKGLPGILKNISPSVSETFGKFVENFKKLTGIDLKTGPFGLLAGIFKTIAGVFSGVWPENLNGVSDGIKKITGAVNEKSVKLFSGFSKVFAEFSNAVSKGFTWTFDKLGKAFEWFSKQLGAFSKYITSLDMVDLFKLLMTFTKFANFFDKLLGLGTGKNLIGRFKDDTESLGESVGKLSKNFSDMFENFAYFFERAEINLDYYTKNFRVFAESIKAGTILEIAASIFLLAESMKVLSEIPNDKLGNAVTGMLGMVTALGLVASIFSKMGEVGEVTQKDGFKGLIGNLTGRKSISDMIMSLALSLVVMSAAMKILSTIDWEGTKNGLIAVGGILLSVLIFINTLSGDITTTGTIAGATTKHLKGTKASTVGAMAMILSLANAMILFAASMKILSTIDFEGIKNGLIGLGSLLVGIFLFINNLDGYSGSTGKNNASLIHGTKASTFGAIGMILTLANSLLLLSVAMKILSTIDWPGVGKGLASIAGLLYGIFQFIKRLEGSSELSKISGNANGMDIKNTNSLLKGTKAGTFGVFAGIFMLAMAIIVLAAAMKVIETMDVPSIAKGLTTIGALMVEIFAFMWGLSEVVKASGTQLLMVAGSIETVALGLLTLAAGVVILGLVPVDMINTGLGIMAGALVAIGAFLKFLSESDTLAMLAAGGGFALVAAGLLAIALGLLMIANIDSTQLMNAELTLLSSVMVLAVVIGALALLGKSGDVMLAAGALTLISVGVIALAAALKILETVNPVNAGLGLLVLAGALVVLSAAGAIMGMLWDVLLPGAGVLAALGAAAYICAAALKVLGEAMEYLGKGIAALVQGLLEGLAMIINFFLELGNALAGQEFFKLMDVSKISGKKIGTNFAEGVTEGAGSVKVEDTGKEMVAKMGTGAEEQAKISAPQSANAFTDMFGNEFMNAMPDMEGMSAEMNKMMQEQMGQFDPEVGNMMIPMMENMDLTSTDLNKLTEQISENAFGQFDLSAKKHSLSSVEEFQKVYLDQFTAPSFRTDTKKTMTSVMDNIEDSAEGKERGKDLGEDITYGIGDGLTESKALGHVKLRAGNVIDVIFDEMRHKAKSASPSKRARDEVGKWIPYGVADGLMKFSNVAMVAAGDMTDDLFGALESALNGTNDLISGSLALDPTITPLMDLSQIQNGVGAINSMLGGAGFGVNSTLNGLNYANAGIMASLNANATRGDKSANNIVDAVNSLKGDVKNLGEYISQLEIRMDSGALVGSLASPMDKQLGIRAMRSRRERSR